MKTEAFEDLVARIGDREPLGAELTPAHFVRRANQANPRLYANTHDRLGIDFSVERLDFPSAQAMDPRIVRIRPGRTNERHRHAHESIFVVMRGRGQVLLGDASIDVAEGDIAFVPRWMFHQTRNLSATEDLVVLAITDFGLTSAVLGDYDRRTRQKEGGEDSQQPPPPEASR
jgi:mannose-6-phosphate isomerase-like protein (cupin superfamily)